MIVRPPLPAPVVLKRVHWRPCGDQACVSINEAKSQIQNAILIGRWMSQMNAAMTYYRNVTRDNKTKVSVK